MGLKTRRPNLNAVRGEAQNNRAYTAVKKQQGADGETQAEASGGQIIQQEDLDRFAPYGFWSDPPADSEQAIIPKDGADAAVGERLSNPASCSVGSCGCLYGAGGSQMHPGNGGDGLIEPEGGQCMKVGATATKAVNIHGDFCTNTAGFGAWLLAVEVAVNALATAYPVAPPLPVPAVPSIAATGGNLCTTVSTVTKLKAE